MWILVLRNLQESSVIEICYFLSGESKLAFPRLICHFLNTLLKICIYFHLFVIGTEVGNPHPSLLLSTQSLTRLTGLVICLLLLFFPFFNSQKSHIPTPVTSCVLNSLPVNLHLKSQIFCSELEDCCTYMNRF